MAVQLLQRCVCRGATHTTCSAACMPADSLTDQISDAHSQEHTDLQSLILCCMCHCCLANRTLRCTGACPAAAPVGVRDPAAVCLMLDLLSRNQGLPATTYTNASFSLPAVWVALYPLPCVTMLLSAATALGCLQPALHCLAVSRGLLVMSPVLLTFHVTGTCGC